MPELYSLSKRSRILSQLYMQWQFTKPMFRPVLPELYSLSKRSRILSQLYMLCQFTISLCLDQ